MMRWLLALCLCLSMPAMAAGGKHLPAPVGLGKNSTPAVVVLFSLPDCAYCEKVRQQSLRHLEADPRYKGKVRVFEIDFQDDKHHFTWFDGQRYTGAALGPLLNVKFSPTVMVFAQNGQVAGKPLLGAGLPDFYGAYLDELIAAAWAMSKAPLKL